MHRFNRLALLLCLLLPAASLAQDSRKLRIFFIDVEGGQSTLFVTPGGQSLLIDTGWPGNDNRDANRIVAAAHEAGISKIDYVLLTHYHADHTGGVPQLVAKLPVGTFIDHGPNRELDGGQVEGYYAAYQKVLAAGTYQHLTAHPGDKLPIQGLDATVLSADGQVIAQPLPGAGQTNRACGYTAVRPADQTENARSLGILITFGGLRILDLGDLTWDKERDLMCPVNKIGFVDILVVSHHGWMQSSSPALIDAIQPRVAIMDNGEKKGGSTPTLAEIQSAPGLQTLWQLHYSDEAGPAGNTPEPFIANLKGTDPGNYIELDAALDGSFSVKNARTGYVRQYYAVAAK